MSKLDEILYNNSYEYYINLLAQLEQRNKIIAGHHENDPTLIKLNQSINKAKNILNNGCNETIAKMGQLISRHTHSNYFYNFFEKSLSVIIKMPVQLKIYNGFIMESIKCKSIRNPICTSKPFWFRTPSCSSKVFNFSGPTCPIEEIPSYITYLICKYLNNKDIINVSLLSTKLYTKILNYKKDHYMLTISKILYDVNIDNLYGTPYVKFKNINICDVEDKITEQILNNFTNITSLSINQLLPSTHITLLQNQCSNIQSLYVYEAYESLYDHQKSGISKCVRQLDDILCFTKELTNLYINCDYMLAFPRTPLPKLKLLHFLKDYDNTIKNLPIYCPNLESLLLGNTFDQPLICTDNNKLDKLKYLYLGDGFNQNINDLLELCPNLEELYLRDKSIDINIMEEN